MTSLRSDAARSRARILEVARARPTDDLRFNELAREAGVGVGTVYRHFPNVPSLLEALHHDAVEQLIDRAREAVAAPDAGAAFDGFIREAVRLQVERDGLQAVLLSPELSPQSQQLRDELGALLTQLLANATRAGAVRPEITVDHVQRLVCGAEHAVRIGDGGDRDLLLSVVLAGLRP